MSISKEKGQYYQEKWEELQYRFANIEMKEEIDNLQKENKQLIEINENKQKEIDKLVCIIYKATEYINNASYFDGSSMCANDLLEILDGKDKELKKLDE